MHLHKDVVNRLVNAELTCAGLTLDIQGRSAEACRVNTPKSLAKKNKKTSFCLERKEKKGNELKCIKTNYEYLETSYIMSLS